MFLSNNFADLLARYKMTFAEKLKKLADKRKRQQDEYFSMSKIIKGKLLSNLEVSSLELEEQYIRLKKLNKSIMEHSKLLIYLGNNPAKRRVKYDPTWENGPIR
jgi:hypothetical protein